MKNGNSIVFNTIIREVELQGDQVAKALQTSKIAFETFGFYAVSELLNLRVKPRLTNLGNGRASLFTVVVPLVIIHNCVMFFARFVTCQA